MTDTGINAFNCHTILLRWVPLLLMVEETEARRG